MKNKGWKKLMRKAAHLAAYICPLCDKPTPEREHWMPGGASPKTRQDPRQNPQLIVPEDLRYKLQWQCQHCKAWHPIGVGWHNFKGAPIRSQELMT